MFDIIKKKRDGLELSQEEIQLLIDGLVAGTIPDYQISAFLMALYFRGMNDVETAYLTSAVLQSGEQIDLSDIEGVIVDKHSTGGVGDKTTIVLAPLVAAAGVPVAKMSGRGLGHTGGTIDKLESFDGFDVDISIPDFIQKVKTHQVALCGQSANLVPADKKLYALRDVTATINNRALITSSIMSKKLACGADAIVIDMKLGNGAFIQTLEKAEDLGQMMIRIGQKMNRQVAIIISAMDQPLGFSVGNALEVKEAIETLKGNGPDDLVELCLVLGANMLLFANKVKSLEEGKETLQQLLDNGTALQKFKELIQSQGGDITMVDQPNLLPCSSHSYTYNSPQSGYISQLSAFEIGRASVALGAGRITKKSKIDLGAGILLKKKIGDRVEAGEPLAILYAANQACFEKATSYLDLAYDFSDDKVTASPIIIKTL